MGRKPCCSKEQGLNRGAWTVVEDKILTDYIKTHGEGRWRNLPQRAGLKRCGKSCRLRWLNYLRPDIKRGNISPDEEELILRLHKLLGNRWSLIAGRLPGRTDNEIKNYWNTNLGKKVQLGQQQNTTNYSRGKNHHSSKFTKMTNSTKPKTDQSTSGGSASWSDKMAAPAQVVRTKAVKCTSKVILNPQPRRIEQGRDPAADKEPKSGTSNMKSNADISHSLNPAIMGPDHDTSPLDEDGHHIDHNLSALDVAAVLSLNDDKLFLTDLLNSEYEFSDFLTTTHYGDENYVLAGSTTTTFKDVRYGSTSDLLLSKEMSVQEWSVPPNVPSSEFNSFSSVLLDGAEKDWLAD